MTWTMVQRIPFTGPLPRIDERMYAVGPESQIRRRRDGIDLEPGVTVSTNAYFGRFAAAFWQRYTDVKQVRLELDYNCGGNGRLRVKLQASDISGRPRPLDVLTVEGSGTLTTDLAIDRYLDGGAIWLELECGGESASVDNVRWSIDRTEPIRPSSVVICTHNRPDDCVTTVTALASDPVAMEWIDAVYVVDQGDQRVADAAGFPEVEKLVGDKLHYLNQLNLGGAGGFTRGIYEVLRADTGSNVIVMDDDIVCEPESVLRQNAFANFTTQPVLVGAQMLLLSETYRLHMGGEWEALDAIKAGVPSAFTKNGPSMLEENQDARFDAGWNGWWTCLLPAETVHKQGLSLPMFFQWDDIEYGIRARRSGFPTVTLPNAGVWHADFHLKDYDHWSRYFSIRNGLIVSSIYGQFDGKVIGNELFRNILEHIVAMQYGLAATLLLAVEDFLAGPDGLHDGGQAKLAELSELRAKYPDTVMRPADVIGAQEDPNLRIDVPTTMVDETKLGRVRTKRAVNQYLGRVQRRPVSMPAHFARWWHVSLFDRVVVTDASQGSVRIRQRDKDTAVELTRRLLAVRKEVRRRAPEMKKVYTEALPGLTSVENWRRLWQLDG
ncbi:glycosyltransferase [Jongsikchunia kroppenstedtii]|uniref:glycosyltransferase n=1 Tax=Jongsikchunia kroppenstedtii TaxID=1121721 RepID=UPI001FDFFEBB|nr:glycosyltransferase [Jongsikchunia kroppenstedtii]